MPLGAILTPRRFTRPANGRWRCPLQAAFSPALSAIHLGKTTSIPCEAKPCPPKIAASLKHRRQRKPSTENKSLSASLSSEKAGSSRLFPKKTKQKDFYRRRSFNRRAARLGGSAT
jgi:hypothetical protein